MFGRRKDIPVGPPTRTRVPQSVAVAAESPARERPRWRPSASRSYDLAVLGLAFIGMVLRVATMATRGLWLDEATTIYQTSGTLIQTIQSQIGGTHPPLFHVLMHYWIYAFGTGEVTMRSFAMLFGVAAIPAAYWAGSVVYDRKVGLIAATILTVSPFHIWYSQEARMYTMVALFALLSVGAFVQALEKNDFGSWAAYFAFSLAGAFTQYLFLLLVIGQGIYYVVFEIVDREIWLGRMGTRKLSRRNPLGIFEDIPTLKPYVIAVVVMAIPVLLWLNWAVFFPPNQDAALVGAVTTSGLGYGAPKPSLAIRFNDVLETIVELLFGSHSPWIAYGLVAMWPLLIYFAMLIMGGSRYISRRTTLLLCSASGVLVVWGLGQWQGVVLLSRYLIPMAAPGLILLASVIARMADRGRRIALSLIIAVCLVAYVSQSFDPNSILRYQNREAILHVADNQRPNDVILYEPFYIDVLVNYYLPPSLVSYGFPRFGAKGEFRDTQAQIYQDLSRVVGPARRVWIIRAFQNVPSIGYQAFMTDQWFKQHGYTQTEHTVLNKAEWLLYTNNAATSTVVPGSLLPSAPGTGTAPAGVAPASPPPAASATPTGGVRP
jgi:uncharacterized membrane protein